MMYISGIGHVSPLAGGNQLPSEITLPEGNIYKAIEPSYGEFIDARQLRRMARVIKMSVAAASMAMKDAKTNDLDAIITGTSLGCIEDTQEFLKSLITDNETLLSPTAFIKSTHNTIGGQIALMGNHYCYNMTYAHRAFSFESALLDGTLWLQDGDAKNILVGGIDELTHVSTQLLQRLGCIWSEENPIAPKGGEGAVFMVINNEPSENHYAIVNKVSVCHHNNAARALQDFLQGTEVDFVLTGACNPEHFERDYELPLNTALPLASYGYYKHLCGEYHTSSAIGTLLGATMLKENKVPQWALLSNVGPETLNNILIYNRSGADGHAFILLSK
ncbi:beta-ketoacyl synthase chain length factor [soil metagenome]